MVVEHPVVKGIEGFPEIGHIGIYPARKARHVQRPCTPFRQATSAFGTSPTNRYVRSLSALEP